MPALWHGLLGNPLIAMDMKQYTFPFHARHITIPMKFHGGNANNMVRNMG